MGGAGAAHRGRWGDVPRRGGDAGDRRLPAKWAFEKKERGWVRFHSRNGAGRQVLIEGQDEMRTRFDQFAKQMTGNALAGCGTVRIEIRADTVRRTKEDEELIMATDDVLERYNEQLERKGSIRTQRENLVLTCKVRFGGLPEDVEELIARTDDLERLRAWHRLALCASAEEVAAAIRAGLPGAASKRG